MGATLTGRSKRRGRAVMSEINVTPLVDVMLVLLVIFMVTAPLLQAGVEINLPKAHSYAISHQDEKPLEISINDRGNIYLGETKLTIDELQDKLKAIAKGGTEDNSGDNQQRVYIKADLKTEYGKVAEVMATCRTSGFTKVAFVTDPTMKKD